MTNWSVTRKIGWGFAFVLVQAFAAGLFGLWMMQRTSSSLQRGPDEYLPVSDAASRVERGLLNARIHFIYFVTIQKAGSLEKGWERFRLAEQDLSRFLELMARSRHLDEIRAESEQLRHDFESYKPVLERIIAVVQRQENHGPEFTALVTEWARLGGAMVDSAGRLAHHGAKLADSSAREAALRLSWTKGILGFACVGQLLAGLVLAVWISRSISSRLRQVAHALSGATERVSGNAQAIAGTAETLARDAQQQGNALGEVAAAGSQISSIANRNAQNSVAAAKSMSEASDHIAETNTNLEQMMVSMDEILTASGRISAIMKTIDGIAFQSNLLALNAAVEAARAGEAGLGFAVVAGEVRTLALRSAEAAKDTAALIEDSMSKSSDGKVKLERVATAVRAFTSSAGQMQGLVEEVRLGSQEQARGIEQVAQTIVRIETVTHQASQAAKEGTAAAAALGEQFGTLTATMAELDRLIG